MKKETYNYLVLQAQIVGGATALGTIGVVLFRALTEPSFELGDLDTYVLLLVIIANQLEKREK